MRVDGANDQSAVLHVPLGERDLVLQTEIARDQSAATVARIITSSSHFAQIAAQGVACFVSVRGTVTALSRGKENRRDRHEVL